MIKPHKYLDYNNSVIVNGALILNTLRNQKKVKYSYLLGKLEKENGRNARFVFPEALSFLFLLGLIEYDIESDTVELIA